MDDPVVRAAVRALAVHHHRRGGDHAADAVAARERRLEQSGRAAGVVVDGAASVDHRLAIAHDPTEVEDAIDPDEGAVHRLPVAQVAHDQLGVGPQVARPSARVSELVEVVEHAHALSTLEQRIHEMGADEAGASGDEDAHQTVYSTSSVASAWVARAPRTSGRRRSGKVAAAAAQARGTRNRKMRSVSALAKPSSAAIASTARRARAAGTPAPAERSMNQEIGRPSATRNAVGEPNSQNSYGR